MTTTRLLASGLRRRLGLPLGAALLLASACSQERTCATDERTCSGRCVAVQSDALNCGACGHACAATQGCSAGVCVDCTASGATCVSEVVVACYNLDQVRPLASNLAPAGAPIATDSGPNAFASISGALFVSNSVSSTISALTLDPPSATRGAGAIAVSSGSVGFGDLEYLAAHGGRLWASNAAAGTLVVLDPLTRAAVDELALALPGEGFVNPQGLDFVGSKAYLALAGSNAVAVIDASAVPGLRLLKRIDLAPLAAAGAVAGPSRVLALGTRVYVTLNDLDASYATVTGANGRLAVIDTASDALASGAVDLGASCLDPSGLAADGSTLWIACGFHAFNSSAVTGTALVPVDVGGLAPVVGTPVTLSSAATSVAACNGILYAGASESGTVLRLDPATGAVSSALACPPQPDHQSFVPAVACAR